MTYNRANTENQEKSTSLETAITAFLRDKGKGEAGESGNYRSDAEVNSTASLRGCKKKTSKESHRSQISTSGRSVDAREFVELGKAKLYTGLSLYR